MLTAEAHASTACRRLARSPHGGATPPRADAARERGAEAKSQTAAHEGAAAVGCRLQARRARTQWAEFAVDVWITPFNSVEFGIYKHTPQPRQVAPVHLRHGYFAEVIENGERTGLLGYREDLWRKSTGMDKRLVFKLFSETLNWRATMDLMIGRSLQLTLGARGLPVT